LGGNRNGNRARDGVKRNPPEGRNTFVWGGIVSFDTHNTHYTLDGTIRIRSLLLLGNSSIREKKRRIGEKGRRRRKRKTSSKETWGIGE